MGSLPVGQHALPRWCAAGDEGARSAGRAGWAVGPEVPARGAGGLPTRLARSFSAQLLHQGGAIHSQQFGRTILVAPGPLQGLFDEPIFELGEQ